MTLRTYEISKKLTILTIPGLNGSDSHHWQTKWEHKFGFSRIEQDDWGNPDYSKWAESLYKRLDVIGNDKEIFLVAHSLGCLLVVKSFQHFTNLIKGVLLVAPPDLNNGFIKKDLTSFSISTFGSLGIPGYLIYSENDPYASAAYSEKFGKNLGVDRVNVGRRGHINSDSHLGDWEEGVEVLRQLLHQSNSAFRYLY